MPARSSLQCALVMPGEVSVEPQLVVSQISSPRTFFASACDAFPGGLRQRGAGIEDHAQPLEDAPRQAGSASSSGSAISKPRGTLNQIVGCTSAGWPRCAPTSARRRPALVDVPACRRCAAPCAGCGCRRRCGSTAASPPAPASRARRKRHTCAIICWLAHSMRWVLITTFGWPVEPEVNRYLAWVSGVMASKASITAGVSGRLRLAKASAPGKLSAPRLKTTGACSPASASAGP